MLNNTSFSVVTTLYESGPFLEEFHRRITQTLHSLTTDYEIILVNDGSPDNSLDIALKIAKSDTHVTVVDLARNFGHHTAILAGFHKAKGDYVFYVDSDLEEPPELLSQFYQKMLDDDTIDVVHGKHSQVEGSALRRYTSRGFWRIYNWLSDVKVEPNSCSIRLVSRRYLNALLAMPERNIFLGGMFHWPGFKQEAVKIQRKLRRQKSTYSFIGRMRLFLVALSDFSTKPLQLIFFLGVLIASISGVLGIYLTVVKFLNPSAIAVGFTALILSIWFVGGLIMITLGIIGIYIARIYTEVKNRPQYVVRNVYNFDKTAKKENYGS